MENLQNATIRLSDAARQRVSRFLADDPTALGLRFGVKRTGCSGWGYAIDLAHQRLESDQLFDVDGVPVLVDAESLPLVAGTEIDFVRDGLNHQFTFRNPNAAAECGCGESFTTSDPGDID